MSSQNTNIRYNTTQTSSEYLFVVRLHCFTFKTLHPRLQCLVVANIHSLLRQSFSGRLCDSFLIFALKHRFWVRAKIRKNTPVNPSLNIY